MPGFAPFNPYNVYWPLIIKLLQLTPLNKSNVILAVMNQLNKPAYNIALKPALSLLAVCLCFFNQPVSAQQSAGFPFSINTKRILFLGNSITYAGTYITDIESYFLTRYPNEQVEFINAGLPSETVSGLTEPNHANGQFPRPDLHERLERVLSITKPDLVFACYGMNDGIYMPLDAGRFKAYQDGMRWLHHALEQSGIQKIVILTPPVHDDPKLGTKGYNLVLDQYAQWLLAQRDSLHWEVADIHFPMTRYLEIKRQADPGFKLAEDGVHPGVEGHWLMAKTILLWLGQQVNDAPDIQSAIQSHQHAAQIYELVSQRQLMMKDAWLTAAGHQRPGMNTGLPLPQARASYDSMELQLRALLK